MDGPILGLMKFGEKKYMDDFRLNGTIYMNTLLFFRTLENKGDVGDEFEGLDACYQSDKVNIKITTADGKSIILSADDGSLAGQIKTRNDSTDFLNVYCMYMIRYCKKCPLLMKGT